MGKATKRDTLDQLATQLHIKRHGPEAYYRGEGAETLERISQHAEEYDEEFLEKHPELEGRLITVYHDPIEGEDLAVVDDETGRVVEVFNKELRSRLSSSAHTSSRRRNRGAHPSLKGIH